MEKEPAFTRYLETMGEKLDELKEQGVMTGYFLNIIEKHGENVWVGGQMHGDPEELLAGIFHLMRQIEGECEEYPFVRQMMTLLAMSKEKENN